MQEPKIINGATKIVSVKTISEHPRNPNRNELSRIVESIEEDGFYGTVLVQKSTGYILAGNHRYRAAITAGYDRVPATFVDVDDETAYRILVKDNRLAEFGKRDSEILSELLGELADGRGLAGTGFTQEDLDEMEAELRGEGGGGGSGEPVDPNYARQVEAPVYEIKGDRPDVSELRDNTRTLALEAAVEESDAPDDVKEFLRAAAARHTVFDYEKVAEFYAHASPSVQRLFEASALVIIDFESAVEGGFVTLTKAMADAYDEEQEEDGD